MLAISALPHRWPHFHSFGCDGQLGRGQLGSIPAFLDRFDINLAWPLGGLHDHLRQAVEKRTLGFFVALLAVGIAIADSDEYTRSGDLEADQIACGWDGAALLVQRKKQGLEHCRKRLLG